MKNFTVTCCKCGTSVGPSLLPDASAPIQTTLEGDDGYSNWTVMDSGYAEFKCGKCGSFASTKWVHRAGIVMLPDSPNDRFSVVCASCGSDGWSFISGDVDHEDQATAIICRGCGQNEVYTDSPILRTAHGYAISDGGA
jgi:hypothetical protein